MKCHTLIFNHSKLYEFMASMDYQRPEAPWRLNLSRNWQPFTTKNLGYWGSAQQAFFQRVPIVCDGVASMTSYGYKAHSIVGFYICLAYHLFHSFLFKSFKMCYGFHWHCVDCILLFPTVHSNNYYRTLLVLHSLWFMVSYSL